MFLRYPKQDRSIGAKRDGPDGTVAVRGILATRAGANRTPSDFPALPRTTVMCRTKTTQDRAAGKDSLAVYERSLQIHQLPIDCEALDAANKVVRFHLIRTLLDWLYTVNASKEHGVVSPKVQSARVSNSF